MNVRIGAVVCVCVCVWVSICVRANVFYCISDGKEGSIDNMKTTETEEHSTHTQTHKLNTQENTSILQHFSNRKKLTRHMVDTEKLQIHRAVWKIIRIWVCGDRGKCELKMLTCHFKWIETNCMELGIEFMMSIAIILNVCYQCVTFPTPDHFDGNIQLSAFLRPYLCALHAFHKAWIIRSV